MFCTYFLEVTTNETFFIFQNFTGLVRPDSVFRHLGMFIFFTGMLQTCRTSNWKIGTYVVCFVIFGSLKNVTRLCSDVLLFIKLNCGSINYIFTKVIGSKS